MCIVAVLRNIFADRFVVSRKFVVFSVLCVLLSSAPFSFAKEPEQSTITFYGKVVDEVGNPIAGATVHAQVYFKDAGKGFVQKAKLVTDSAASFHISKEGTSVAVRSIKKKGYVAVPANLAQRIYSDSAGDEIDAVGSNAENPMVFVLRKKGEPAFLIQTSYRLFIKTNEKKHCSLDIDRPSGKDKLGFTVAKDDKKSQLVIETEFDSEEQLYRLNFTTKQEESGVFLSDRQQHVAPQGGYKREETVNVEAASPRSRVRKHILVRTVRDGIVQFSRLDMDFLVGKGGLIVNITSWTNPDGSPNLEYDEMHQRRELMRRTRQARQENRSHEYLGSSDGHFRKWDFTGNRRRSNRLKRTEQRVAEGTLGEKKQRLEKKKGHD